MFNEKRLSLAKRRRGLNGKRLAEVAGLSPVTISRIENGENPDDETVASLSVALGYPREFFERVDDPEEIDTASVSFRSLSKMSAKEREASIAAGVLGLDVSAWLEREFSLPRANLIDLSYETDMEVAARSLRQHWNLGEKPVGNMLHLLELHGVRVFSLSEDTATVDAFSFWRDDAPFVFLNTYKSAERSIFDSAHELGHLVCHRHAGTLQARSVEREADAFASAFLMPAADVRARVPSFITIDTILKAKKFWRVSAMAMAYRLHALGLLTEWRYKSICIELGRRGYRSAERDGVDRETSVIWKKVLTQLWAEGKTKAKISADLHLPMNEIESLIWGLTGLAQKPERATKLSLRAVK
jgi:Zn-dependent peptidase ImmA (M78 family)/DNA-binding XRE family transcriptional regulator